MSQQLAKRSACDRCRDQKLRCPRTEDQCNEPCARCQRAGAICVTSNPRPLGRPRITANDASSQQPSNLSTTTLARGRRPVDSTNCSPRKKSRVAADSGWNILDDFTELLGGVSSPGNGRTPSWMPNNPAGIFGGLQVADDESLMNQMPTSTQDHEIDLGATFNGDHGPQNELMSMDNMNYDYVEDINEWEGSRDVLELPGATDALVRLSRLNETLGHQLSRVSAYPWRSPLVRGVCAEKIHGTSGNPVSEVLQSTGDFINVLRGLQSPSAANTSTPSQRPQSLPDSGISLSSGDQHEPSPGQKTSLPSNSPIGTPVVLLLLSSHIQLLQLYDTIFFHVYHSLQEMPDHLSEPLPSQAQPHVQVPGVSSMTGHLYIKILIQVIAHHLDTLERAMDLPAEFRISKRASSSTRVPSGLVPPELVHAVMGQAGDCIEKSGMSLVISLRENMKKVQELLEI
ncbi:hypothetical protein F4821DRAFT_9408 [Hypoxylon rubiginosum]|uniref:Uncharacterized protein n=1 Tax=Hypoxylon rubiginosum TaxID=110542 RepID=A0ACC0DDT6_9PEZI|nr:hypothetical protein F4821DRAFT_9408 [Hypoxylon rubiginosum]